MHSDKFGRILDLYKSIYQCDVFEYGRYGYNSDEVGDNGVAKLLGKGSHKRKTNDRAILVAELVHLITGTGYDIISQAMKQLAEQKYFSGRDVVKHHGYIDAIDAQDIKVKDRNGKLVYTMHNEMSEKKQTATVIENQDTIHDDVPKNKSELEAGIRKISESDDFLAEPLTYMFFSQHLPFTVNPLVNEYRDAKALMKMLNNDGHLHTQKDYSKHKDIDRIFLHGDIHSLLMKYYGDKKSKILPVSLRHEGEIYDYINKSYIRFVNQKREKATEEK